MLYSRSVNLKFWHYSVFQIICQTRSLDATMHAVITGLEVPAVVQESEAAEAAQHAQQGPDPNQQGSNSQAQHAHHAHQVLSPGGVLRKPRPVGIGHMCRAISTLTGGIAAQLCLCMTALRSNLAVLKHAVQTYTQ